MFGMCLDESLYRHHFTTFQSNDLPILDLPIFIQQVIGNPSPATVCERWKEGSTVEREVHVWHMYLSEFAGFAGFG